MATSDTSPKRSKSRTAEAKKEEIHSSHPSPSFIHFQGLLIAHGIEGLLAADEGTTLFIEDQSLMFNRWELESDVCCFLTAPSAIDVLASSKDNKLGLHSSQTYEVIPLRHLDLSGFEEFIRKSPDPLRQALNKRIIQSLGLAQEFESRQQLAIIAEAVSSAPETIIVGPEGIVYVRVPWTEKTKNAPGRIHTQFHPLGADDSSGSPQTSISYQNAEGFHLVLPSLIILKDEETFIGVQSDALSFILKIPGLSDRPPESNIFRWQKAIELSLINDSESVLEWLKPFARPIFEAGLDGLHQAWLTGWIKPHPLEDNEVTLQIDIDGVRQSTKLVATLPRGTQKHKNRSCLGFAYRLPSDLSEDADHEIRLYEALTGRELACSPYNIGPSHFDANFSLTPEGMLIGSLRSRSINPLDQAIEVELTIDGRVTDRLWPQPQLDNEPSKDIIGGTFFRFERMLPDGVFDTKKHTIGLNVLLKDGRRSGLPDRLDIEARYRGYIDIAEPGRLAGWILNEIAPSRSVRLDVYLNGRKITSGATSILRPDLSENNRSGFDIAIPIRDDPRFSNLTFSLRLLGTEINPLSSETIHTPIETAIQSLTRLIESLRSPPNKDDCCNGKIQQDHGDLWVRTEILEPTIRALRDAGRIDHPLTLTPKSFKSHQLNASQLEVISVLIPVYEGLEATTRCIKSVLASGGKIPFTLSVINDCSPNPLLTKEIRELQKKHGFTLVEQKTNLGFVGTVNKHLASTPQQDVVLLNADTVVASGWLDRLHTAAYSADNIGTVTPLSNNATLVSYPVPFKENPLPSGEDIKAHDVLCATINAGTTVDIPTGVGFCLFLKRAMIDEVGLLDHRRFGKGYGEENDYCLRASEKGWRHVAACNVYVGHEGSVSFGKEKEELIKKNLETLNGLYPDYAMTVARFEAEDPLAFARNRMAIEVLKAKVKSPFLFLTHGLGGGTERAVTDLAESLTTEGQDILILRCEKPQRWVLRSHGHKDHLVYHGAPELKALLDDLKVLNIQHLHYHETLHYPAEIWDLPESLNCRFDVTVHDYLAICPRITFLDGDGTYCGERQWDSEACDRCIQRHGLPEGMDTTFDSFGGHVENWRNKHKKIYEKARVVFAPTDAAAQPMREHFSLENLAVKPHPECPGPSDALRHVSPKPRIGQDGLIRIAVIGAIGESKGFSLLKSCISDAEIQDLPLLFHIVGFTQEDESLLRFENVRITGRYRPDQASEVIRQTGAGIALFLSPWPETWSYTLSEALDEGLLPVSLDIGAIAERIQKAKTGHIIPLETKASAINDALIKIAEEDFLHSPSQKSVERESYPSVLGSYYGFKNLRSHSNGKNQVELQKTSKAMKSPKPSTRASA